MRAFTDVTMGQIVDRSKPTKDGKFRPWIKRMCGPVAIASFLIYQSGFAGMAIGFGLVAVFLWFIYPLDKKRVEENVAELARRRSK